MVDAGAARGNLVHDAHIAALALENGVTELWTSDRDFSRFIGLRVRNPFKGNVVHDSGRRYMAGR
jgi:predicted nucleic acid-binding protein